LKTVAMRRAWHYLALLPQAKRYFSFFRRGKHAGEMAPADAGLGTVLQWLIAAPLHRGPTRGSRLGGIARTLLFACRGSPLFATIRENGCFKPSLSHL
jgi:hypothetical protein